MGRRQCEMGISKMRHGCMMGGRVGGLGVNKGDMYDMRERDCEMDMSKMRHMLDEWT